MFTQQALRTALISALGENQKITIYQLVGEAILVHQAYFLEYHCFCDIKFAQYLISLLLCIFLRTAMKKKRKSDVKQSISSIFPFCKNFVVILKVLHPIKIVHFTMKQFQNKNTSAQCLLGEHGP